MKKPNNICCGNRKFLQRIARKLSEEKGKAGWKYREVGKPESEGSSKKKPGISAGAYMYVGYIRFIIKNNLKNVRGVHQI